jgi:hypothetical protein
VYFYPLDVPQSRDRALGAQRELGAEQRGRVGDDRHRAGARQLLGRGVGAGVKTGPPAPVNLGPLRGLSVGLWTLGFFAQSDPEAERLLGGVRADARERGADARERCGENFANFALPRLQAAGW